MDRQKNRPTTLPPIRPGRTASRGVTITEAAIALIVLVAIVVAVVVIFQAGAGDPKADLGDRFQYNTAEFRTVDPKWILYDEDLAATMPTGLAEVRSLAVGADDTIYVAGDQTLAVFAADGQRKTDIPLPGRAHCLAVDTDGTLYVVIDNRVTVLGPDGTTVATWPGQSDTAILTSIAVTDSDVYVAVFDTPRVVLRYDKTGTLLKRIGLKDPRRNIPGFVVPSPYFDLAMASDGLLRVAHTGRRQIDAFTRNGDLERSWGESSMQVQGFAGCCNPVSFAIAPDGGVVTCEKGIARVKLYDSAGTFLGVVAAPDRFEEGSDAVLDVAVDSRSRVLVLDPDRRTVRVFLRKPPPANGETP